MGVCDRSKMGAILFVVFALSLLILSRASFAQTAGTWIGECTSAHPCTALADVPVALNTTPTACVLSGLPGAPRETPVINKTDLPQEQQAVMQEPKVCRWPTITLSPGSYTLTAIAKDAAGRISDPSNPLSVTVLQPLSAPGNLRLVE